VVDEVVKVSYCLFGAKIGKNIFGIRYSLKQKKPLQYLETVLK